MFVSKNKQESESPLPPSESALLLFYASDGWMRVLPSEALEATGASSTEVLTLQQGFATV